MHMYNTYTVLYICILLTFHRTILMPCGLATRNDRQGAEIQAVFQDYTGSYFFQALWSCQDLIYHNNKRDFQISS